MTDIESRLTETLQARSKEAPSGDAVLDGLDRRLAAGPGATTSGTMRRLTTPLLAVAAVATLVVGTVTVLGPGSGADDGAPPPTVAGDELPASLEPPPGQRLVGLDGVAVAVPEGWATDDVDCGFPQSDTVHYPGSGTRLCLAHVPGVSAVIVQPASALDPPAGRYEEVTEAGGLTVGITPASADEYGEFTQSLVIEDRDVAFTVLGDAAGPELVRSLLESMVALPRGYVAIPAAPTPDAVIRSAELAGLLVETNLVDRAGWSAGALVGSEPALGSVVPVGTTLTLRVTSGGPFERVELTVGHCWLEPVEFAQLSWNLPYDRQFGWGGSLPDGWVGAGAITQVGPDQARYVDDGGEVLHLIPAGSPAAEINAFCA